jgi:hypothetical protein
MKIPGNIACQPRYRAGRLVLSLTLAGLALAAGPARAAKNDPAAESTPDAGRTAGSKSSPAPSGAGNESVEQQMAPPAPPPAVDLAKLRSEYDRLRDELFRSRARAELVEEGIYESKLAATLRWKGAPDFILRRAEIRLDGNSIWDSGEKPLVDELIKVSERPAKPGPHTLTVRIEVRPGKKSEKEHADLGYESEQTFVIDVPDGQRTNVVITGDDDGDLPGYEPEVEIEVRSEK